MPSNWQPTWDSTVDWGSGLGDITCAPGTAPDPTGSVCVVSTGLGCDPTTLGCNFQCPGSGVWTSDVSLCPGILQSLGLGSTLSGSISTSTLLLLGAGLVGLLLLSDTGGGRRRR